jgi:hypothetical protein
MNYGRNWSFHEEVVDEGTVLNANGLSQQTTKS